MSSDFEIHPFSSADAVQPKPEISKPPPPVLTIATEQIQHTEYVNPDSSPSNFEHSIHQISKECSAVGREMISSVTQFLVSKMRDFKVSVNTDFVNFLSLTLFPIRGNDKDANIKGQDQIASNKGYLRQEIDVVTSKNSRKIEAWEKFHRDDAVRILEGEIPLRPTVVIFHTNNLTGSSMLPLGNFYHALGYNVIMPTMGGYPGSPGVITSEASAYQDVEAIKQYLSGLGVKEVGFHGTSLGGALAIHAAATDNPPTMRTSFVVADQTFTSADEVAANFATNLLGKPFAGVARSIMNTALPQFEQVELPGKKYVYTNGFNSLSKMNEIKKKEINIAFITASHDHYVGEGIYDQARGFDSDHANQMSVRVYGDQAKNHIIRLENAAHASFIDDNTEGFLITKLKQNPFASPD